MREARLWLLDPPSYFTPPGGFLSFAPPHPRGRVLPARNFSAPTRKDDKYGCGEKAHSNSTHELWPLWIDGSRMTNRAPFPKDQSLSTTASLDLVPAPSLRFPLIALPRHAPQGRVARAHCSCAVAAAPGSSGAHAVPYLNPAVALYLP